MAPEQARGRQNTKRMGSLSTTPSPGDSALGEGPGVTASEITHSADIYALGAILYECLTGRPPFKAATPVDTLLQVISDEPVPPRQLQSGVPRDLETICLKCLRKEPRKRFATALDLAGDLRRFQKGEPIKARPVGRVERSVKWVRRNLVLAGSLAAVALSLVAGALASTWFAADAWEQTRKERDARERTDVARHALQMGQLLLSLEQDDLVAGKQILDDVPAQFQDTWEYRHLAAMYRRKALPLAGFKEPLRTIALSGDGRRVVVGGGAWRIEGFANSSTTSELKMWDAVTGKELRSFTGHTLPVCSVALSSEGKRLVSVGCQDPAAPVPSEGEVIVWDTDNGQPLATLKAQGGGWVRVVIDALGNRIAYASSGPGKDVGELTVWDVAKGQALFSLRGDMPHSLAMSADGERLVSGYRDGTVRVRETATGRVLPPLEGRRDNRTTPPIVGLSADGKRIMAVFAEYPAGLMVWEGDTGRDLLTLAIRDCAAAALSADGKRIVLAQRDGTVKVLAADSGHVLRRLRGSEKSQLIALNRDGSHLATGGVRGVSDYLRRDGQEEEVKVWGDRTGQELTTLAGPGFGVAVCSDGRHIVSGGGDAVKLWDAATGKELRVFRVHKRLTILDPAVLRVAVSPDDRLVAAACLDGSVKVWEKATGKELHTLWAHVAEVWGLAFSPDGKHLISGGLRAIPPELGGGKIGLRRCGQEVGSSDRKRVAIVKVRRRGGNGCGRQSRRRTHRDRRWPIRWQGT
jgi:WD40 repeat protein